MDECLNISDDEREAKQLFFRIFDAYDTEICKTNVECASPSYLPQWFEEEKFKNGQKFYKRNQFAISVSNLLGLTTVLSESTGLEILAGTNRSSTIETARKRYVETAFHVHTWYECDLSRNSDLWKSLNRVRYLHVAASKSSIKKNIGFISYAELTCTIFGFMGFVLVKPHLFGIGSLNYCEREDFIHFWAVMAWILGINDEINYCLRSVKVCEIVCHMMIRYLFAPLIQLELGKFEIMSRACADGINTFFPLISYDAHMFFVRQACGIPGYQFGVDLSKEVLLHDIFTTDEINELNLKLARQKWSPEERGYFSKEFEILTRSKINQNKFDNNDCGNFSIMKTVIQHKDFQKKLNNSKFYQLDLQSQFFVIFRSFQIFINRFSIGRWFNNSMTTVMERKMFQWYTKEFQRSPIS